MASPDLTPVDDAASEEAEEAVKQLAAALAEHGIVLPSLDVDTPSYDVVGFPLIELGRCTKETARALAAALSKGPRRPPASWRSEP